MHCLITEKINCKICNTRLQSANFLRVKGITSNSFFTIAANGERAQSIPEALLFWIARDKMPYETVNKEGFRYFASVLEPLWKVPCRDTVTRHLSSKSLDLKAKCILWLKKTSSISLTCDGWSDKRKQSYLGVTAHFVSLNIQEKSRLVKLNLGLVPLFLVRNPAIKGSY